MLWDLDGVLADTFELHYQTWRLALAEYDLPLSREEFLPLFGLAPVRVMAGLLGPECASISAEIRQRKETLFNELAPEKIHPTPGALAWLKRFSGRCPQAVASSAPPENIDLLLDILKLRHYFQVVVSGAHSLGKPDPSVFLAAVKQLRLTPGECLVIEDSPSGVEAARRAGIPVIAICTSNPPQALAGAGLILPDLASLTEPRLQNLVLSGVAR